MTTYYLLFYQTVEGFVERRAPFRAEHLELLKGMLDRDQLLMAGALDKPANEAILVFRDEASAQAFAHGDPYVREGLIRDWQIRPWKVAIGGS